METKGAWPESRDLLLKFWDPSISLKRLNMLQTSNLVSSWRTANIMQKCKIMSNGAWPESRSLLLKFWNPLFSWTTYDTCYGYLIKLLLYKPTFTRPMETIVVINKGLNVRKRVFANDKQELRLLSVDEMAAQYYKVAEWKDGWLSFRKKIGEKLTSAIINHRDQKLKYLGYIFVGNIMGLGSVLLRLKWHEVTAVTRIEVIQGRIFWYQSKARMRIPIRE